VDGQELITRYRAGERDFSRADLSGDYLMWADLVGADLSEADLSGANLYKADLNGAKLRNANLCKANPNEAKVTSEQLALIYSLEGAIMPDGTKHW